MGLGVRLRSIVGHRESNRLNPGASCRVKGGCSRPTLGPKSRARSTSKGVFCSLAMRHRFFLRTCRCQSDTESDKVNPIRWRHHESTRSARIFNVLIPSSPFKHFVFTSCWPCGIDERFSRIRLKPIQAPLPNISVHIHQTPGVGAFEANWVGGGIRILRSPSKGISEGWSIAKRKAISCPCTTGIFPLGLRG